MFIINSFENRFSSLSNVSNSSNERPKKNMIRFEIYLGKISDPRWEELQRSRPTLERAYAFPQRTISRRAQWTSWSTRSLQHSRGSTTRDIGWPECGSSATKSGHWRHSVRSVDFSAERIRSEFFQEILAHFCFKVRF